MHRPSVELTHTCNPGAIRTVTDFVSGDPIVFTSTEWRHGAKIALVLRLFQALSCIDSRWSTPPDASPLTLHKSPLGGPLLLLGHKQGPSLSFSHGGGRLWAAISGAGGVGIDVAYPEEFTNLYPFARAFRAEELECARGLCRRDTALEAAMVWSAKEAAVKAAGIGFNLIDPLEVRVGNPSVTEQGIFFEVLAGRPVSAWVRKEDRGWLCVAFA